MRRLQQDEVSDCRIPCKEERNTTIRDLESWYVGTILGYRVDTLIIPFEVTRLNMAGRRGYFLTETGVEINHLDTSIVYELPDLGLVEWDGLMLSYTRANRRQWRRGNRSSLINYNIIGSYPEDASTPRLQSVLYLFYNKLMTNSSSCRLLSNKFALDEKGAVYYLSNVIGQAEIIGNSLTIKLTNPLMAFPLSLTLQDSKYASYNIGII